MENSSNKNKKIRKGDKVIATAGNNRGQIGTVLSCLGDKVVVQGLNIRKKHMKRTQARPQGAIVSMEKPIHISNVRVCVDDKPVKLKVRVTKQGHRELYYKDGEKQVAYRPIKKQTT